MESVDGYQRISGLRLVNGVREFLLSSSPDFMAQLRQATELDPWRFGFATVHKIDNLVIGLCGFAGPPDSDRLVEIAYSIAPNQGKGYATEEATALVDYAFNSNQVKTIRAHTFAEFNPSTRVLEKCGFKKSGRYFIRKITSSGVGKK